jgi:hypothetical protein
VFPRPIDSPCPFCSGDYNLDLLWVQGRAFQFDTCCEGSWHEAVEWTRGWSQDEWGHFFAASGLGVRRVLHDDPYRVIQGASWPIDWGITITPLVPKDQATQSDLSYTEAWAFIDRHHRHLGRLAGQLWGYAVWNGRPGDRENLLGVAIVGRPASRMIGTKVVPHGMVRPGDEWKPWKKSRERSQLSLDRIADVSRMALDHSLPRELTWKAASALYDRSAADARAKGYTMIITYILGEESGMSLRFTKPKWKRDKRARGGGQWGSGGRKRKDRSGEVAGAKQMFFLRLAPKLVSDEELARREGEGKRPGGQLSMFNPPSRDERMQRLYQTWRDGTADDPYGTLCALARELQRIGELPAVELGHLNMRMLQDAFDRHFHGKQNPPCHSPKKAAKALGKVVDSGSRQCYPASEAFYHSVCGQARGYTPMQGKHEGMSHWWVKGPQGKVTDLTSRQFQMPVPYSEGRGRGWLTKKPSKRAVQLMRKAGLANPGDEAHRRRGREAGSMTLEEEVALYRHKLRRGELFPEFVRALVLLGDPTAIAMGAEEFPTIGGDFQDEPVNVLELFDVGAEGLATTVLYAPGKPARVLDVKGSPAHALGPVFGVLCALGWLDHYVERMGPSRHAQEYSKLLLWYAMTDFLIPGEKRTGINEPRGYWWRMVNKPLAGIPVGYHDLWPSRGMWPWAGDFLDNVGNVIRTAVVYGGDGPQLQSDFSFWLHLIAMSITWAPKGWGVNGIAGPALRLVKPWALQGSPRHFDPRPYLRGIKP